MTKLQGELLKALKQVCLAWSNNATGFGMRGIPDVTVVTKQRIFFIEVKDERTKDKMSDLQEYRKQQIEECGHYVYICRTKEDVNFIVHCIEQWEL
jgi:hypothetical protein